MLDCRRPGGVCAQSGVSRASLVLRPSWVGRLPFASWRLARGAVGTFRGAARVGRAGAGRRRLGGVVPGRGWPACAGVRSWQTVFLTLGPVALEDGAAARA